MKRRTTKRKRNGLLGDIARGVGRAAKATGRGLKTLAQREAKARADLQRRQQPSLRDELPVKRALRSTSKRRADSSASLPQRDFTDAEVRKMIADRDPRVSAKAHRKNPRARKSNSGDGKQFRFHGAYFKKRDALEKEAKTAGSFIKFTPAAGGRFLVVSRISENPASGTVVRVKKSNVQFGEYEKGVFHPWTRKALRYVRPAKKGTRRPPRPHVLGVRKSNPRARRRNGSLSDAAQLYKDFHGREATKLTDILQRVVARSNYAGLGTLVCLKTGKPTYREMTFSENTREAVMVASDVNGNQLFLLGGNQDCDSLAQQLNADSKKDLIDMGELTHIEYFTHKAFDKFKPVTYTHKLGEESGIRPRLMYDRLNRQLHIVGGNYKVKPEGIAD